MNWPLFWLVVLVVLEHVVLFVIRDAFTFDPKKAEEAIKSLFKRG